jgi:hypothetical protein
MYLTLEEAISLLKSWESEQTVLRIHFSGSKTSREVHGSVRVGASAGLRILTESEEIDIDLSGADFNGDRRSPPNASHGAYLVCEFKNDDRLSLYAPRPKPSPPQTERRRPEG